MSSRLAKRLRKLAYEQNTSESSIIECALWHFFDRGSDADVLSLMSKAEIPPRRRRS
jgi:predicted transcriptional regulator